MARRDDSPRHAARSAGHASTRGSAMPSPVSEASVGLPSPVDPDEPGAGEQRPARRSLRGLRVGDRAGRRRSTSTAELDRTDGRHRGRRAHARRRRTAASWQASLGGDGWAALAEWPGRLLLTPRGLELLAREERDWSRRSRRSRPWGANQRWLWQSILNGITLHHNFADRGARRAACARRTRAAGSRTSPTCVASCLATPFVAARLGPARGDRGARRARRPDGRSHARRGSAERLADLDDERGELAGAGRSAVGRGSVSRSSERASAPRELESPASRRSGGESAATTISARLRAPPQLGVGALPCRHRRAARRRGSRRAARRGRRRGLGIRPAPAPRARQPRRRGTRRGPPPGRPPQPPREPSRRPRRAARSPRARTKEAAARPGRRRRPGPARRARARAPRPRRCPRRQDRGRRAAIDQDLRRRCAACSATVVRDVPLGRRARPSPGGRRRSPGRARRAPRERLPDRARRAGLVQAEDRERARPRSQAWSRLLGGAPRSLGQRQDERARRVLAHDASRRG